MMKESDDEGRCNEIPTDTCQEIAGLNCEWDGTYGQCSGGSIPSSTECGNKLVEIAEQALTDGGHSYCLAATEWPSDGPPPTNCQIISNVIYGPDGEPMSDYAQTSKCRTRMITEGDGVRCPIDCSSFTKWVYERYGDIYDDPKFQQSFTRSATWQGNNVGVAVDGTPDCATRGYTPAPWVDSTCEPQTPDYDKLEPGDLIIMCDTNDFNGNGQTTCLDDGISHVGLYVGNELMIDAGNPVKKRRVDTFKYVGARRLCGT